MNIVIDNELRINLDEIDDEVLSHIKKDFRTDNPHYGNEDEPKFLNLYNIDDKTISFPRGMSNDLCEFLDEFEIEYDFVDNRTIFDKISFPKLSIKPYKYQAKAIKKAIMVSQGTIESPCGSGKTAMAIAIMEILSQPTLIIVPDNELLKQWVERLYELLKLPLSRIGVITSEKIIIDDTVIKKGINDVTISTNASLYKRISDKEFCDQFGCVILDEAHIVGARTFRQVMNSFSAYYRFGVTATPFRNDNLSDLIEAYCGRKFAVITDDDLFKEGLLIKPELKIKKTPFYFKYNYNYSNAYDYMLKAIQKDKKRNELILDCIYNEWKERRMVLIVAKRTAHCKILQDLLTKKYPKIRIGSLADNDYDDTTSERARKGELDVIFSVNRAIQGLDIKPLETVMLIAPRKARGEIQQIVGRVCRPDTCFGKYKNKSDKIARVYDFVDDRVVTLNGSKLLVNAYEERNEVYKYKCKPRNNKRRK